MGAMSDINLLEKDYADKESKSTQVREELISLIVETESNLGISKYSYLALRQFDNAQLRGIATNLKIKLKNYLNEEDELSEGSLSR